MNALIDNPTKSFVAQAASLLFRRLPVGKTLSSPDALATHLTGLTI
jgi:hypothetical protein